MRCCVEKTYTIPNNIVDIYFFNTFKKYMGEFYSFELKYEDYCNEGSTGNWYLALQRTCFETDRTDVLEYYNNLEWYDADQFCVHLADDMLNYGVVEK